MTLTPKSLSIMRKLLFLCLLFFVIESPELQADKIPGIPANSSSTPIQSDQSLNNPVISATPQLLQSLQQGNAVDILKNKVEGQVDKTSEGWLKNLLSTKQGVTEISLQGITSSSPVWSFLLLRPVTESKDLKNNTFIQTSIFREDGRTTLNLGYGYRRLAFDDKVLLGTNLFYDHEFPYNHQRMSVGGEVRTTVGEINVNAYRGVSDWKTIGTGVEEKALGGYDTELSIALPYIPSAHFRYKHFIWNGVDGVSDLLGNTFSLTGTLYEGLSLEAGYTDYSSGYQDYNKGTSESFARLSYNISIGSKPTKREPKPYIISTPYSLDSMVDHRFEKVRRENRIIKTTKSFDVTTSGR